MKMVAGKNSILEIGVSSLQWLFVLISSSGVLPVMEGAKSFYIVLFTSFQGNID